MLNKEPDRYEVLLRVSENMITKLQNHDERLEAVEKKVSRFPGDTRMQLAIKTHLVKHVAAVSNGVKSPSFKENLSRCYHAYWQAFGVTTYKDTPAGMYDEAIAWIDRWRPIVVVALEDRKE